MLDVAHVCKSAMDNKFDHNSYGIIGNFKTYSLNKTKGIKVLINILIPTLTTSLSKLSMWTKTSLLNNLLFSTHEAFAFHATIQVAKGLDLVDLVSVAVFGFGFRLGSQDFGVRQGSGGRHFHSGKFRFLGLGNLELLLY